MNPPNKTTRAYIANHLYARMYGASPDSGWRDAILTTNPLYFKALDENVYGEQDMQRLFNTIMELCGVQPNP